MKTWQRSKLLKDKSLADGMRTELEALHHVSGSRHAHVANVVDVLEGAQAIHCVLEYCGGGSLLRCLQGKGHGVGMQESEAAPLIAQVRAVALVA